MWKIGSRDSGELITLKIRYHLSLWRKVYVTFPKDIEVMAFTFGHKNTDNIPS